MAMAHNGLAKLNEEAGELHVALGKLQQTIGKMLQYPQLQTAVNVTHPDGTYLRECLQNEMGDVMAALDFVKVKLELDEKAIIDQWQKKIRLFNRWDSEP
jgi:NTP pyrophosphatase (non-canonical NTP hydrolase)